MGNDQGGKGERRFKNDLKDNNIDTRIALLYLRLSLRSLSLLLLPTRLSGGRLAHFPFAFSGDGSMGLRVLVVLPLCLGTRTTTGRQHSSGQEEEETEVWLMARDGRIPAGGCRFTSSITATALIRQSSCL